MLKSILKNEAITTSAATVAILIAGTVILPLAIAALINGLKWSINEEPSILIFMAGLAVGVLATKLLTK
jgi:hypothetical protein